jgi:hypothetical protein
MFIVMTAKAKMPSSCWGTYKRIAVVECDSNNLPKQINPKHKSVKRIMQKWERLNVGRTNRCAYQIALVEAIELCEQLNKGSN